MDLFQFYNDLIRPQYRRDHAPNTSGEQLTFAGRLVLLRNIWTSINTDFFTLKSEILKTNSSPMIYNPLVYRITISLQSLLNSIARLCNDLYPIQASCDIYFHTYTFSHPNLINLCVHQVNISNLVYNGTSFNKFADTLQFPWVGLCNIDHEGVIDIFDDCHIGLVDNILYVVLKNSSSILQKLDIITDNDKKK